MISVFYGLNKEKIRERFLIRVYIYRVRKHFYDIIKTHYLTKAE